MVIERMVSVSDIQNLEAHRSAITGHCYRMLGSFFDAEDATQETMIRACRGLDRFDGRASLKNWLYRIATNVCLDEIHNKSRRARPMEEGPPFSGTPSVEDLVQRPADAWIEPISDTRALPSDSDPSERAILKQSIRLAFVAALQKLAPKQRAALLLMDVLGFSAAEAAETLDTSVASGRSASPSACIPCPSGHLLGHLIAGGRSSSKVARARSISQRRCKPEDAAGASHPGRLFAKSSASENQRSGQSGDRIRSERVIKQVKNCRFCWFF